MSTKRFPLKDWDNIGIAKDVKIPANDIYFSIKGKPTSRVQFEWEGKADEIKCGLSYSAIKVYYVDGSIDYAERNDLELNIKNYEKYI